MKDKIKDLTAYKLIPTHILENKCFACGKDNPEGLHMKFYTDNDKHVFSEINLTENKRGWEQVVHGGIVSTILDEIMAWTAIYFKKQFMLTKTIQVNFLHPLKINTKVKAVGWIEEQTNSKEIMMRGQLYSDNGKLCAEGNATFALFSKKLAARLKIMDASTVNHFDKFITACDELG